MNARKRLERENGQGGVVVLSVFSPIPLTVPMGNPRKADAVRQLEAEEERINRIFAASEIRKGDEKVQKAS